MDKQINHDKFHDESITNNKLDVTVTNVNLQHLLILTLSQKCQLVLGLDFKNPKSKT